MIERLLHLIRTPGSQPDEDRLWRLWLARLTIVAVMIADTLSFPLFFITGSVSWMIVVLNLLVFAAGVLSLMLLHGDEVEPAVFGWLLAQWVYLLAGLLTQGGVRSMFISSFILLILVGGLLLDPRRYLWFAAFAMLTIVSVMALELVGETTGEPAAYSPTHFWVGLLINSTLAGVLIYLYGRTIRHGRERSRLRLLEQLAAESTLRQSQERYRNFIEHSFEGVWLMEFNEPIPLSLTLEEQVARMLESGYVAECNDAFAHMQGVEQRASLLGKPLPEIIPAPHREEFRLTLADLARSGFNRREYEVTGSSPYGDPLYFITNSIGLVENGCLSGIWSSQRDVTARRMMQEALLRRTDQLAALNRISNAVSTLKDMDSLLKEVLARLQSSLPLDSFYVGLYDEHTHSIYFPLVFDSGMFWESQPDSLERGGWLASVFSSNHPLYMNRTRQEVANLENAPPTTRHGDTGRVSASLMAVPLQVGSRNIGVISVSSYTYDAYNEEHLEFLSLASLPVAIAIDNSRLYESLQVELEERLKVETALQRLNVELEQRVEERTAQLEKAMHELEAFSYSVSHDLRAPLRAIDGYSRFLVEDYSARLDAEGLQFLDNVRKAAQRMGMLIDDLLNLSRVVRVDLHIQPVSLSDLCAEIIDSLRLREPQRSVTVEIMPDLTADGDAHLLRLALENLVGNAWKFTGHTSQARIEFGERKKGKKRIFYVRDNGAGFDMRYSDQLFKPFTRLHAADEFEGTGIGLASVKRVIERHGGEVWAEAEVNHGAAFYFTLCASAPKSGPRSTAG